MSDDGGCEAERLGGVAIVGSEACRAWWFDGGVFVIDVHGHLTDEGLREHFDRLYTDTRTLAPYSMIFQELEGCSYDRSVLAFHRTDSPRPLPVHLGVVVLSPLRRMVATAAGLGYRAATGVSYSVYDDLVTALMQARVESAA